MVDALTPLQDGAWLDYLDAAFLRAAYPQWAGNAETRQQAAAVFRTHGLPALAQLAANLPFHPEDYSEAYPETEGLAAEEAYRYWLTDGIALGQAGAPRLRLGERGMALAQYPACFPWQHYARMDPQAGANRWAALNRFLDHGFAIWGGELSYAQEGASDFFTALGDYYSNFNDGLAVQAYERARAFGALPPYGQQHLADAYLRHELWRPALDLYRDLIARGAADTWTLRNAARCADRLGIAPEAQEYLPAMRKQRPDDPAWPETIAELTQVCFAHGERGARAAIAKGDATAAEAFLSQTVTHIVEWVGKTLPPRTVCQERKVLIVANLDDLPRANRRLDTIRESAGRLGYAHSTRHFGEIAAAGAESDEYSVIVLFRVPALAGLLAPLAAWREAGRTLIYDSDESLEAPMQAPPLAAWRGYLFHDDYENLAYGRLLYRAAARLCDYALAPSETIAATLRPLCRGGEATVTGWPACGADSAPAQGGAAGLLSLRVYSFTYLDVAPASAGAALFALLAERQRIRLTVAGPVKLAPEFAVFGDRIARDEAASPSAIGLIVPTPFADPQYTAQCLWSENARLSVPCAMLLGDGLLPELVDGETVMRAEDGAQWRTKLEMLLDGAERASRIGLAARAAYQNLPTPDNILGPVLASRPVR